MSINNTNKYPRIQNGYCSLIDENLFMKLNFYRPK